jgi:ribosomal protein S18 acetylase RimI-like enzyme
MEDRVLELNGRTFQVTGVKDEDWDWIKDGLEESFVRSIPQGFDFDAKEAREKAIMEAGKLRDNPMIRNEILIIRSGEKRAGILWIAVFPFQYTGEMRGWILQVYVDREFRGTGVGKALISLAEAWTFENGMDRIGLNVGSSNHEAISLYRSMGFDIEAYNMGKRLPISNRDKS